MKSNEQSGCLTAADTSVVNGIPLRVPASYRGLLPPSPCRLNFPFEPSAFLGLQAFIRPGMTVLDIGCSYGIMSTLVAHLVGPSGSVYSFDANPEVFPMAEQLFEANGFNAWVHPVRCCVGESSGTEVEFHVVPSFFSVASSRTARIHNAFPKSQTISAPMMKLDDLYPLLFPDPPSVMKIDIEGGEWCALRGASALLARYAPDLVIETHAGEIAEIGGSLPELCTDLVGFGYHLFDLQRGELTSAQEYAGRYANAGGQLLASRKLSRVGVYEGLYGRWRLQREVETQSRKIWRQIDEGRRQVNEKRSDEAIPLLRNFLVWAPDHAEAHYLLGFALHNSGGDLDEALDEYDTALKYGFDEFWTRYNIGVLCLQAGKRERAASEIQRAAELNPEHVGASDALKRLSEPEATLESPQSNSV